MARYWPKEPIRIAEPCSATWEAMQGDARMRHCAECDRDVHNTAALTPRQIEELLSGAGALPCLRVAHFADGSMLVAEEARSLPRFGTLAGAAMTALVSISAASVSAQSKRVEITLGRKPVAQAVYSGLVLGTDGKPAAGAHVSASRMVEGKEQRVEAAADAHGNFRLQVAPGEWKLSAVGVNGPSFAHEQAVTLRAGEQSAGKPLQLELITVTAGIPLPPPQPAPPTRPGARKAGK